MKIDNTKDLTPNTKRKQRELPLLSKKSICKLNYDRKKNLESSLMHLFKIKIKTISTWLEQSEHLNSDNLGYITELKSLLIKDTEVKKSQTYLD